MEQDHNYDSGQQVIGTGDVRSEHSYAFQAPDMPGSKVIEQELDLICVTVKTGSLL